MLYKYKLVFKMKYILLCHNHPLVLSLPRLLAFYLKIFFRK